MKAGGDEEDEGRRQQHTVQRMGAKAETKPVSSWCTDGSARKGTL